MVESPPAPLPDVPASPVGTPAPDGPRSELTIRAVVVGLFVAALVGALYPYVVMKLGFGPTISVVAAFFAFIALNLIAVVTRRRTGKYEYNMVQTAGTAAAQSSFMCVVLGAFDLLNAKPELGFQMHLSSIQIFVWISISGCLGVLLAVPLRKHFIDEEKLTFADGTAAGESLVILDSGSVESKKQVKYLTWGAAASAVVAWLTQGMPQVGEKLSSGLSKAVLADPAQHPPGLRWSNLFTFAENSTGSKMFGLMNVGMNWSLLSIGSGMLVGLRITLSMALGSIIAYVIMPSILVENGWVLEQKYKPVLLWVMWPATGLLVVGGLTGLALKWKAVAKTFTEMRKGSMASGTDFPLRWVGIGVAGLSVTLIIVQYISLGVAPWMSALAILISVVLMLVGIRVLGETNWAPISAMANMVQAMFAVIAPANIGVNMVASGMSGTVAGAGEHLMQDYKAGKIIGSNNRSLTYMQLIATPVGAGAIAIVYPLLRSMYGMGPDRYGITNPNHAGTGLASPISVKWAGFAELLMGGVDKLPKYSGWALLIAAVLAVLITLGETTRFKHHLPSPTGMALGMLIPAMYVVPMVVGAYIQLVWSKTAPKHEEAYNTPLASGFIVGEAMIVLVVALLVMMGVLGASEG
jgi:uncharacterized oligopeptide transporter (OPT) family protein